MHVPTRPVAPLLLIAGLMVAAPLAGAADPQMPKTSPGKPALTKDAPPGKEHTPGPLQQRPRGPQPVDPMERLRERLAEKLGPKVAADGEDPDTVRVNVRAAEPDAASSPKGGGTSKAVRRRAEPAAPKGAWSHAGETGPANWARLRPDYAVCGNGRRQSPIDIRDGIGVHLDPIDFDYKASSFGVIDTGRTVRVNLAKGNTIEVMGRRYQLDHVEFRRPAEERINGRQFDMGAHLVHNDAEGRTAVVAVLLERGAEQPVIQTIWNNLPLEKGEELAARAGIDFTGLLPTDRRYYTYMGSMTTPPCKEGVLWMVMQSPVAISAEQLAIFSRLYPMNARPVQPVGDRLIKGPQ